MAMSITVAITLDEGQSYTDLEAGVIRALGGNVQTYPEAVTHNVFVGGDPAATAEAIKVDGSVPAAAVAEEAPAEKPKRSRAPRQSTRAAVLEDTPEPTAEEVQAAHENMQATVEARQAEEEDPAEAQLQAMETPTLQDAVTLATDFLGKGQTAQVKAALAKAGGASRVSELKGDNIGLFISALEAA